MKNSVPLLIALFSFIQFSEAYFVALIVHDRDRQPIYRMAPMKLHWFWSFNPQKVRLALNELDIEHEVLYVDLFRRENRDPAFAGLNPNAKVPVLEDGETCLWESNAILVYLAEKTGKLWPRDAAGRGDAARWLFFEARHLNDAAGALWFNDFVMPMLGMAANDERRARGAEDIERPLSVLDDHLATRDWLLGKAFSLVDCAYGPVLDALALSDFDITGTPHVAGYVDRVRERPAWACCEFRGRGGQVGAA